MDLTEEETILRKAQASSGGGGGPLPNAKPPFRTHLGMGFHGATDHGIEPEDLT
jgi:hypothetical protein